MKQIIRDYFTFNKREKNGIAVLICILLILTISIHYSDKFGTHETVDFSKFEKQLQDLDVEEKLTNVDASDEAVTSVQQKTEIVYFNFDPNNLPEQSWKKLGLSDKQIRSIKNYEAKGGTFRSKADVKKMYSIPPALYTVLEPYIQLPEKQTTESVQTPDHHQPASQIKMLEINTADSLQLSAVKGIGPFFAKTIIRYRNLLGGFYKKEQLMEVWKLDEEKYKSIEKYLQVDTSKIIKININTCTAKELKHPYLSWKIVNGIINYRTKHGDFYTVNEIKKTDLIDSELFSKMAPYLKSQK